MIIPCLHLALLIIIALIESDLRNRRCLFAQSRKVNFRPNRSILAFIDRIYLIGGVFSRRAEKSMLGPIGVDRFFTQRDDMILIFLSKRT